MHRLVGLGLLLAAAAAAIPGCSDADEGTAELDAERFLERLRAIEGMRVTPMAIDPMRRWYSLELRQPVDHDDPGAGYFEQHMALLHRGEGEPVELRTAGYGREEPENADEDPDDELTRAFGANILFVEHRFFGTSKPAGDALPWMQLTARQAAADHHRIVEALKPLYRGPWLEVGGSKGGRAALHHRRFYPDDVDAVVAYVAPNSLSTDDLRYSAFLDQVGDAECRAKIVSLQRALLARRAEVLPLLEPRLAEANLRFTVLGGVDVSFEHAVQEYRFAFWQYASLPVFDCASLPAAEAPGATLADEIDNILAMFSDSALEEYAPYYYQAATESGSYGPLESGLSDLLEHPGTYRAERYPPMGVPKTFDPAFTTGMAAWIAAEAKHVVLVYGERDPWTAGAFDPAGSAEVKRFLVPGGDHLTNLEALSAGDREAAYAALGTWLGRAPAVSTKTASVAQPLATSTSWQQRWRAAHRR